MRTSNTQSTRRSIIDKAYDPTGDADAKALARVVRDVEETQALVEANHAERLARGDVPVPAVHPFELKGFLEASIRDAVRLQILYYDAASGYACVRKRDLPTLPRIGEPGWGDAEWEAESQRQWAIRTYEDNLAFALEHPSLHALALLLLDAPREDVGVLTGMRAFELARDFGLVASGAGNASPPVAARVNAVNMKAPPVTFGGAPSSKDGGVETWENGLVVAIWTAATKYRELPAPQDRVRLVLELLQASVGTAIPPAIARRFREPTAEAMRRAAAFMRGLRLQNTKPEYLPPGAHVSPGRPKTEWGAARDFAHCFGVPFVEKRSRIARRK